MFRRVEDFLRSFQHVTSSTSSLLSAITDENLGQSVGEGYRTVGEIAWHIVVTIPEMMNRTGLGLSSVDEHAPPPSSAKAIADAYEAATKELIEAIGSQWTDETLLESDEMYGGESWRRGATLAALINHEIHHRGQLTVLLRQAGASVPGVVGPSKQEWAQFGMEEPSY